MPCFPFLAFAPARRLSATAFALLVSLSIARAADAQDAPAQSPPPVDSAPPPQSSPPAEAAPPPVESAAPEAKPAAPEAASTAPPAEPAPEAAPPKPEPYSLPWQLRPAGAGTALRLDTAFAFYEDPATHGSEFTAVPMLLFSYKVAKGFAPLVRIGMVSNSATGNIPSGSGFLNPVLGATYALPLSKQLRFAAFLGLTIPVGSGGGDNPDPGALQARNVGIPARSAMDNAMFAANDFTVFPGLDLAFVDKGFTIQGEVTLLQLTRVRGAAKQSDSSKTNFTMGLHVGYFVLPALSIGAEIRHQRWLSTPAAVSVTPANRDTTTFAVGPRVHIQVAKGKWLRPGIAFAFGLDDPMKKSSYKIVQLDIPFTF